MPATYDSAAELAEALRRAAGGHGKHEEIGHADADWPTWYAQDMADEQAGHPIEAAQGAGT